MSSTKTYFKDRAGVALFVENTLMNFERDLPLTMTITRDMSEGYCVHTVIGVSSAAIGTLMEQLYSLEQ